MSLLRPHNDNGLGTDIPPIKFDGEVEFGLEKILKHRQVRGKYQYLVRWHGYDQSEDTWPNKTQLEHLAQLLVNFKKLYLLSTVVLDVFDCPHCDAEHVDIG